MSAGARDGGSTESSLLQAASRLDRAGMLLPPLAGWPPAGDVRRAAPGADQRTMGLPGERRLNSIETEACCRLITEPAQPRVILNAFRFHPRRCDMNVGLCDGPDPDMSSECSQ